MRPILLLVIGSLSTSCGPSHSVERVESPAPGGQVGMRPPVVPPQGPLDPEGPLDAAAGPDARVPDAAADARPLAGADAAAPPPDASPDRTPPPAPVPDAAVRPPDTRPPDTAPPPPDAAPAVVCPPPAAAVDKIADFENGELTDLVVGNRGGTPWRVISVVAGTSGALESVAIPELCGSRRAMRFAGTGSDGRAPLARAAFAEVGFVDARAYSGIRLFLRSVPPGRVRIKIPDLNTISTGGVCVQCNNHFQLELDADTQLRPFLIRFANLSQSAEGERQPAPALQALFAIEIGAPVLPTFDLLIDEISFVR